MPVEQKEKLQRNLVWDLPLRLFHWLLVFALVGQWITAELGGSYMDWHFKLGYFTLGLVMFRLCWGFVGTRYAKFSQFIQSPRATWLSLKNIMNRKVPREVGHNPVGGLLVPTVIILVLLQGTSGLFVTDDILYSGPYNSSVSAELQSTFEWIHHTAFYVLLAFIVVHVLAIVWHQWFMNHAVVGAMVHGKKSVSPEQGISSSRWILAIVLACLIAAFIYWLVIYAAPVIEDDFYY